MQTLPLTDEELLAWLRFAHTAQVSRRTARALLAAFGLPQHALGASHAAVAASAGHKAADALLAPPPDALRSLHTRLRAWLAQPGNHLVTLGDPAYPRALLDGDDPPLLLYVTGRLGLLHTPALAIVGSRHASAQGLATARAFAGALGEAGLTVVSGLALGIDAAAHRGALGTRGSTLAVIGTGADQVYPSRHRALSAELAQHGALVSEWPLGMAARRAHFPQRNRLIAGLARGVLVVEAAAQSGSLITARLANEIGRDVYAMPGSIHSALTKGCHRLIREGAKLVESVADILEELGWAVPPEPEPEPGPEPQPGPEPLPAAADDGRAAQPGASGAAGALTGAWATATATAIGADAAAVLHALGHDRAAPDLLARRTGLDLTRLQAALLELELSGRIAPLPCGRVEPLARIQPR